ncbi:hypothetical protein A5761_09925 [Mycolicibacterium setense]|nr:hypothetical protein A5761_09925 [Mycolicibacterium setense]
MPHFREESIEDAARPTGEPVSALLSQIVSALSGVPPRTVPAGVLKSCVMAVPGSAWDVRTTKTRSAIVDAALALFEESGVDDTTADQIAERAGVARRTFFRYFPNKESVVFADYIARQARILERLRDRPLDEAPLTSLLVVLGESCEQPLAERRAARIRRIVQSSESLSRREHPLLVENLEQALAAATAERSGLDEVSCHLLASSALSCLTAATSAHLRGDRRTVRELFDNAVSSMTTAWSARLPQHRKRSSRH